MMDEYYSRVREMILDDGGTWDLSPNDKIALRHVLGLINSLAEDLAEYSGEPIPDVIRAHSHHIAAATRSDATKGR